MRGGTGRDRVRAPLHLHKDKAEPVCARGRPLHKRPPALFWDGLLVIFSQVGGTREDGTDEPSGWHEPDVCLLTR